MTLTKSCAKRKFTSNDYHETLLRLHAEWYALTRHGVARPEVRRDYPEQYRFFTEVAFPQFDRVWKPGVCKPEQWDSNRIGGSYRGIAEYTHDTELDLDWAWEWGRTPLVTASPDVPLCILHRKHSETVVSTITCP